MERVTTNRLGCPRLNNLSVAKEHLELILAAQGLANGIVLASGANKACRGQESNSSDDRSEHRVLWRGKGSGGRDERRLNLSMEQEVRGQGLPDKDNSKRHHLRTRHSGT